MELYELLTIIGSIVGTGITTGGVLAAMILTGHRRLDSRIDSIENRFSGLENRFNGLENRLDDLHNRVVRIEGMLQPIFGTTTR